MKQITKNQVQTKTSIFILMFFCLFFKSTAENIAWSTDSDKYSLADFSSIKSSLTKSKIVLSSKNELIKLMRASQLKAIQEKSPSKFLEAEKKYGWTGLITISIETSSKVNSFTGLNITKLKLKIIFKDYKSNAIITSVKFDEKLDGGDAKEAVLDFIEKKKEFIANQLIKEYKLFKGDI